MKVMTVRLTISMHTIRPEHHLRPFIPCTSNKLASVYVAPRSEDFILVPYPTL